MSDPLVLTVLAYGHILFAVGWLGASLLNAVVIGPGLQKLSPASRTEFVARVIPKILRYYMGAIAGTFVFGLLLLYEVTGGDFSMMSPSTTFGAALSAGVALAVIAGLMGGMIVIPSFRRTASISEEMMKNAGQPPPPDLLKYAKRAMTSSMVATVLLLLVLVLMVTAGFY